MCETKEVCQCFTFFWFFLNFYCYGQTLVNTDLPISVGLGIELSLSTSNWFGVIMWFTLWVSMVFKVLQCTFGTSFAKKKPYSLQIAKSPFFPQQLLYTQCEDPLPCHGAPMCKILGHLGNVFLWFGHDPSHLPNMQWTLYPVFHICEEMCESFVVTQVS